jgi:hypothetical protein
MGVNRRNREVPASSPYRSIAALHRFPVGGCFRVDLNDVVAFAHVVASGGRWPVLSADDERGRRDVSPQG